MTDKAHRAETINQILKFAANTHTREYLDGPHPRTGKPYTNEELDRYLDELQAKEVTDAEEAMFRSRAEKDADTLIWQLQQWNEQAPQREAQLKQDRQTFINVSNAVRSFGVNEANFRLIRETLGPGFDIYKIQQALASGALQLTQPTQEQWDTWAAEDVEQHNNRLLNADPETLREQVRLEAEQKRLNQQSEAEQAQLEASRARDAVVGYPPLPRFWEGQRLDAAFIRKCDAPTQKLLTKKYGSASITARLRGIA